MRNGLEANATFSSTAVAAGDRRVTARKWAVRLDTTTVPIPY